MKDQFETYGCAFLNESACEEILEQADLVFGDVERKHYEEELGDDKEW